MYSYRLIILIKRPWMRVKISNVFYLIRPKWRQKELRRGHRIGPAAAVVIPSSVRAVVVGVWCIGGQSDGRTSRAPDSTWRLIWKKRLQIDLTPRAQVQLLYTVKRANLTRLAIWRSSRSESRHINRTDTSRSTRFWSLQIQSGATIEHPLSSLLYFFSLNSVYL